MVVILGLTNCALQSSTESSAASRSSAESESCHPRVFMKQSSPGARRARASQEFLTANLAIVICKRQFLLGCSCWVPVGCEFIKHCYPVSMEEPLGFI